MAGMLSNEDRRLIRELRQVGVLKDIENHLLDQRAGTVLVTCADADRFPDIFHHQEKMQSEQRTSSRIHTLSWHGGAIACAPCSPVNKVKSADKVFLGQIIDARCEVKTDIPAIALYAHAPCGAAALHHVDLATVIGLQMRVKQKVKSRLRDYPAAIAPFFHVDYGMSQRTYFLCRTAWEAWANDHGIKIVC